jgi:hypothetical protein
MDTSQHNSVMHTSTQQLSNQAEEMPSIQNTTQMKQVHGSALSSRITTQSDKESTMLVLIARDIHVYEL